MINIHNSQTIYEYGQDLENESPFKNTNEKKIYQKPERQIKWQKKKPTEKNLLSKHSSGKKTHTQSNYLMFTPGKIF